MPRRYIPREGANPWLPIQKDLLWTLAEAGVAWPVIAQRCGHPKNSCQTTYSVMRRARRRDKAMAAGTGLSKRSKPVSEPMQAPTLPHIATEPSGRTFRTSIMVEDAALRARIAIQGPNGLLGDPLPGRSALDQKRALGGASA